MDLKSKKAPSGNCLYCGKHPVNHPYTFIRINELRSIGQFACTMCLGIETTTGKNTQAGPGTGPNDTTGMAGQPQYLPGGTAGVI